MPHFGIAVLNDGTLHVSAKRRDAAAAEKLVSQKDASHRFVVEAADADDARSAAEVRLEEMGIEIGETVVAPEPPSSEQDPTEPTPEEMAEAAALVDSAGEGDVVAEAAARTSGPRRTPRAQKPRPLFFLAGFNEDGEPVLAAGKPTRTEADAEVLDGAEAALVVRAMSADEATEALVALGGEVPDGAFLDTLPAEEFGPRSLVTTRSDSVETDTFWVGKSGITHASADCRFVRGRNLPTITGIPDAGDRVKRGEVLLASDGKTRATGRCLFCTAKATAVTVTPSPEGGAEVTVDPDTTVEETVEEITSSASEEAVSA